MATQALTLCPIDWTALGTWAGAIASLVVAGVAMWIATNQRRDDHDRMRERARVVAPSLIFELCTTYDEAAIIAEVSKRCVNAGSVMEYLGSVTPDFLCKCAMLEAHMRDFSIFGDTTGAALSDASSTIKNLRSAMVQWIATFQRFATTDLPLPFEERLRMHSASAQRCRERIAFAIRRLQQAGYEVPPDVTDNSARDFPGIC